MGLGANQILMKKKVEDPHEKREAELLLVKGAFAKIIGGAHKGKYCEVHIIYYKQNCCLLLFFSL